MASQERTAFSCYKGISVELSGNSMEIAEKCTLFIISLNKFISLCEQLPKPMQDIDLIYRNRLGIAFCWKGTSKDTTKKVQLIFRDTGLLLSSAELVQFSGNIDKVLSEGQRSLCKDCKEKGACRSLLLDSPAPQITFAVSYDEVLDLQDLVSNTLFQLNVDSYLNENGFLGDHN